MSNLDGPLGSGDDAGPGLPGDVLLRAISARRGGMGVATVLAAIGLLFAWQASLIDLSN